MLTKSEFKTLATYDCEKADSIPYFSFAGLSTICRIPKIVDGDTCDLLFWYRGQMLRTRVRVNGVDTPEKRPRVADEKLKEMEKKCGYIVKERLEQHIDHRLCYVEFDKDDKYGRPLVTLYKLPTDKTDKELHRIWKKNACNMPEKYNIADWLVERGYAHRYDGGTKTPWTEYELVGIIKEYENET